jgi:hypothetical protein
MGWYIQARLSFLDTAANYLSSKMFEEIKTAVLRTVGSRRASSVHTFNNDTTPISMTLNIEEVPSQTSSDVTGYKDLDGNMFVEANIEENATSAILEKLRGQTIETVRHELEHMGKEDDSSLANTTYDMLMRPGEVKAYVAGLHRSYHRGGENPTQWMKWTIISLMREPEMIEMMKQNPQNARKKLHDFVNVYVDAANRYGEKFSLLFKVNPEEVKLKNL